MDNRRKEWRVKASQRELDEVDSCRLCGIFPEAEKTCRAVAYCHRQIKMDLGEIKQGEA